jgi:hypothetical protein
MIRDLQQKGVAGISACNPKFDPASRPCTHPILVDATFRKVVPNLQPSRIIRELLLRSSGAASKSAAPAPWRPHEMSYDTDASIELND